jgi:hypothetical protein
MPIIELTSIPNPPKTNRFITIGKAGKPAQSYANKASTNANISQPTTKLAIHPNMQLDNSRMMRLTVTTNAATNFGLTFAQSITKANVIQQYKQEVALCTIPSSQLTTNSTNTNSTNTNSTNTNSTITNSTNTNSTNDPIKPKKPHQIISSNWTIWQKTGHEALAFTCPHGGDAIALVRDIQRAIRQEAYLAEPLITLLTGHWSLNLTSNFILTFAGNPQAELVYKFEKAILAQHFNYSF